MSDKDSIDCDFPKIGTVFRCDEESIGIGLIVRLDGPFDTAAETFEAWVRATDYRH